MNTLELVTNKEYPMDLSSEEFRESAFALQDKMMDMTEFHVEPLVEHFFAPGQYGRQMTINKDVMIVGKIHKHAHINTISKGIIDVITEFAVVRYEAPVTFISEPLTKRCVRAVEDTIWTTYHVTDETDLDKIEADLIAEEYEVIS